MSPVEPGVDVPAAGDASPKKKVYFPNLNGLRFIAASWVVIHHVEQFRAIFKLPNAENNAFVQMAGQLGVNLFFVLSGFLITYLLLVEHSTYGQIKKLRFYIRRALRIWPLYYLVVFCGLFVWPNIALTNLGLFEPTSGQLVNLTLLFGAILPNVALILYPPIAFAAQSWSIGVEEQCYLLWPWFVKDRASTVRRLWGVIFIYTVVSWALSLQPWADGSLPALTSRFLSLFQISSMAIGGLYATLVFQPNRLLAFFFRREVQVVLYVAALWLVGTGHVFPDFHYEIYALIFGAVIANLAANERSIVNLEVPVLHYLGKISYGLYMFHPLAIVLCLKILSAQGVTSRLASYLAAFALTIILAALSYHGFEERFLKFKSRFTLIASGSNAKNS